MRPPSFRGALVAAFFLHSSVITGRVVAATVSATSMEIFQGEIVELKVRGEGLVDVKGSMGQQMIPFFATEGGVYEALMGADLEARPGPLKIAVKVMSRTDAPRGTQITLRIKEKPFPSESFSVPADFDRLSKEALERIQREQDQLNRIWMIHTPQRLWEGAFLQPVSGAISSPFGLRRIINETPRARHSGTDLKAPLGTDVVAANHGRVVLLAEFFFSGKSLVLDHGGGLFTVYYHLSEFRVEEGGRVRKGDLIALSGMTGRVTGPHLHWGARINGARVDPFELIEKLARPSDKISGPKAASSPSGK